MAAYVHVNSSKYVVLNGYVGSELSYRKLYRGYIGDENNYAHLAYCATTQTTTTQYTSAIDSSGLSSTTALTCESTSGESYLTRESTSGESYLTDTRYAYRFWITSCQSSQFVWYSSLSYLGVEAYMTSTHKYTIDVTDLLSSTIATSNTQFYIPYGTALGNCNTYAFSYLPSGFLRLTGASRISSTTYRSYEYYMNTSATKLNTVTQSGTDHLDSKTSYQLYLGDDLRATNSASSSSEYFGLYKTTTTSEGGSYRTSSYDVYDTEGGTYRTETQYFSNNGYFYYTVSRNSTIDSTRTIITKKAFNKISIPAASNTRGIITRSMSLVVSCTATGVKTTGTSYLTSSAITGTSYLTRESTSAYSGVTTVTTTGPAPIPEPSTDGNHILFLGKNNGRSGLFSNDCGLTWETVTSIFPEFDDGSTYAVQKTAFKLVWHSGYFYFLRVVSKQKYSYSSNYYHWLDIYRIKDDLTGTSEQVLAPYELEYIGNTLTSASVILSTAEAISGTIYLSAKVNSSTVLELDFDALSVVAAVYQTGSVETIRYLLDIGLIGMRNYKSGSSSGNTYNWVFKDILSSSPIAIFPVQYSGSAQMYFTLLDSAHSPGLVHSRDTLLQANWTNAAGGSSKIGYFVDESGTTSFNEISGLGSIIFQDMGTGSNSWIDENFFAYQFGDYLVYSIYKDKSVYVVSNFGSNSPTRTVLFGGTNSGPSLGCVCKDRIILTRNRNIYTVDLANLSSTQVASNVISFSDDSCCFCVNTQHGNCLK